VHFHNLQPTTFIAMRIAVVSDIHGNLKALEAVVRDIERRSVDAVINLGDSLSGPLMPKETAQFLMAQNWTHLAGNHERQILALNDRSGAPDKFAHSRLSGTELQWIASLSPAMQFADDVLICHGTPTSDYTGLLQTAERNASSAEIEARLDRANAALILCGHTHVARSVRAQSGSLIVNPGSVGHPAYADDYPYPHVVETGSPDARYAIVEKRDGVWSASLFSVSYDHFEMAALARARGFSDWESALLTGYLT
jgi:putative phosphoesterase